MSIQKRLSKQHKIVLKFKTGDGALWERILKALRLRMIDYEYKITYPDGVKMTVRNKPYEHS